MATVIAVSMIWSSSFLAFKIFDGFVIRISNER